jgi:membrane protease YdiL (CAAX protease family)
MARLGLETMLCAIGFAVVTVVLLAAYRGATAGWTKVALAAVAAIGLVAVYAAVIRGIEARPIVEVAPRLAGRFLIGAVVGAALVAVTVALAAAFGGYRVVGTAPISGLIARVGPSLHSAAWEEFAFRGLLFRCLAEWLGAGRAVAASALAFGALHGVGDNGTVWSATAVAIEAGVLLSLAFWAMRELWFPIGMHFGWNLTLGGVFGSAVSGDPVPSVLLAQWSGPTWLTGGAFGLEASVLAVVVCTAASLLFWRRGRGPMR